MEPASPKPELLEFPSKGAGDIGYLAIAAVEAGIPFAIRRVFWTYFTPHNVTRGRHAHYRTEMVIIAVHGRIRLAVETLAGETLQFQLDSPTRGLYLPPLCWHTMEYSHDAVQVVLASTDYDASDYIRSYSDFCQMRTPQPPLP